MNYGNTYNNGNIYNFIVLLLHETVNKKRGENG